jgi:hypothetical protein
MSTKHPNCFIGDWVMTDVKHPVSVKEHTCSVCFGVIPKSTRYTTGTPFRKETGDSVVLYAKLCTTCRQHCDPLPFDLAAPEPQSERINGMNLYNVASLLRDDVVTVTCHIGNSASQYTFKCEKALAEKLSTGDMVIANVKSSLDICKVIRVHDECKIDVDSDICYKWIIQRVDVEHFVKLEKIDIAIIEKLKTHKRQGARAQVLAVFGIDDPTILLSKIDKEIEEGE